MGKKKIVFIVIGIIILVLLGIFGYMVVDEMNQTNKLIIEVGEVSQMFNQTSLDYEIIEQKLSTNVSKGDYLVVEKAVKQYLSDALASMKELQSVVDDDRITTLLTIDNYAEDGPDFVNTKEYIQNTRTTLENLKNEFISYTTQEKMDEYISDKGLDEYYIELYNELMGGDKIMQADIEELESSLDSIINMLNNTEVVIDFLIENKDSWELQGENIVFFSNDLVNEYNELTSNIY